MRKVGLTGGIASGKSTVSGMFRDIGVPVIDADVIAREVVAPGSRALEAIVDAFGGEILTEEKSLNRARLGEIVFSDPAKKKVLERILHPEIIAEQDRRLRGLEQEGRTPVAVVDAAVMIESGSWKRFDSIVVVDCDESQQIGRLRRRNGMNEKEAIRRVNAQMPLSEKVKYADHVIDNRGSIDDTRKQVEALMELLSGK
ncbi:MAG: dephospho-CoA kinase [Nitrospinae bacterium]|nr:dephospho-CoA kinase [Nitrospinota bacterium]